MASLAQSSHYVTYGNPPPSLPPLRDPTPDILVQLKKHNDGLHETPLQCEIDRVKVDQAEIKNKWTFVPWNNASSDVADDIVHFAEFRLNQGDTLVFIDTPIAPQSPLPQTNCLGLPPASQILHVHSENLFALTNSKFPKMLRNENYQSRLKKRRQLPVQKMKGIRYLLDLTPSNEGEDVAYHLSELSLSPGIIKWPTTARLMGVDSNLVDGHDDICICNTAALSQDKSTDTGSSVEEGQNNSSNETEGKRDMEQEGEKIEEENPTHTPIFPFVRSLTSPIIRELRGPNNRRLFDAVPHLKIPDYCRVRHAHAIIRLLLMIEGRNVPFNSAAMVWTMVGISKILECPEVVRDHTTSWIMADTKFIEALPEEALRIAFALELPQIARFAFSILVNEAALENVGENQSTKHRASLTVFGRQKGNLDDELRNLVQHAASALFDRLTQSADWLTDEQNISSSPPRELEKLNKTEAVLQRHLKPGRAHDLVADTLSQITKLKILLQRKINLAMDMPTGHNAWRITASTYEEMDMWRSTFADHDTFTDIKGILANLNHKQMLICPFLYHSIQDRFSNGLGSTLLRHTAGVESVDQLIHRIQIDLEVLANARPEFAQDPFIQSLFESVEEFFRPSYPLLRLPILDERKLFDELYERVQNWVWLETCGPQGEDIKPLITFYMNLTLTNNEVKYLPLWAGGRNDGSGGVFEDDLPPAEMGPNGPGPAYHTGLSISQSISESLTDDVGRLEIRGSTEVGSVDVQDGVSTVYAPNHVIAAGSSIASESFVDDEDDFQNVRFEVPADGQASGQAIDMIVGSVDTDMSDTTDEHDFDWLSDSDASDDTVMFE